MNSRISIKESSVAKLGSVCRRVYRIFSHAYFHHRNLFDEFEVTIILILSHFVKEPLRRVKSCEVLISRV